MRAIELAAVIALLALGVGSIACDLSLINRQDQQSPTEPDTTEPTAAPLPPGGEAPPVAKVNVPEIGRENCAPSGPDELTPFPCKAMLTCTPKDAAGNDVALHYTPTWAAVGQAGVTPTSSNPYNARFECDSAPTTVFANCTVGGVTGVKGYECIQ